MSKLLVSLLKGSALKGKNLFPRPTLKGKTLLLSGANSYI